MSKFKVTVKGMNCNHCKSNVENNLSRLEGIKDVKADIEKAEVEITGDHVDLDKVKLTVEAIGYRYMGSLN